MGERKNDGNSNANQGVMYPYPGPSRANRRRLGMRLKRLAGATLTGDSDRRSGGGRHRRSPGGSAVRQPAEGSRPHDGVHRPVLHLVPRRHQLVGVGHAIYVRCVTRRLMAAAAALIFTLAILLGAGARPASASVTY